MRLTLTLVTLALVTLGLLLLLPRLPTAHAQSRSPTRRPTTAAPTLSPQQQQCPVPNRATQTILPTDERGASAGSSVAVSGDGSVLVVGAPGESSGVGGAYVFTKPTTNGGPWQLAVHVTPPTTPDVDFTGAGLGTSVATNSNGTVVVLGAPTTQGGEGAAVIIAFLSKKSYDMYNARVLRSPDLGPDALFGVSVALSSDASLLALGASGQDMGSVAVYRAQSLQNTSYVLETVLRPSSPTPTPIKFGASLALSDVGGGGTASLLVGAPEFDGTNGAVYSFSRSPEAEDGWFQDSPAIVASQTAWDPYGFGSSVAMDRLGVVGIIGSLSDPFSTNGAVWFISRPSPASVWLGMQAVAPTFPLLAGTLFGFSVAMNAAGTVAAAGAPQPNVALGGTPVWYRFLKQPNGSWTVSSAFAAPGLRTPRGVGVPASTSSLGFSLALSAGGGTTAVGAPNAGNATSSKSGGVVVWGC